MQRIQRSPAALQATSRPSRPGAPARAKVQQASPSLHPRAGVLDLFDKRGQKTRKIQTSSNPPQTAFAAKMEKIFRKMAFQPLSPEELQSKGWDFKSAKAKMEEQGIENVEIIQVPTDKSCVQILYAKHPKEDSDPKLAVFIAGQQGMVAQHVDTKEVLNNWKSGRSICLTSFRGYMGNPGSPDHKGQADDLAKILEYLHDEKRIAAENTELYAHSMGCDTVANALAIRANQRTGLPEEVYKEIDLRAPYQNIAAMISHKIRTKPKLWVLYPLTPLVLSSLRTITHNSFVNLQYLKAKSIKVRASRNDEKVPYHQSKKVYARLEELNQQTGKQLEFITTKGSTHDEVCFSRYDLKPEIKTS